MKQEMRNSSVLADGSAQIKKARIRNTTEITVYVDAVSEQYTRGLHATRDLGPAVTVFGSARTRPGEPTYLHALRVGRLLAGAGYTVVTGGGGGIMEAANRGASLGGGPSIGMPIVLPFEESGNPFVHLSVDFEHFPARKTCLIDACDAVMVFAGGFGTLDELFEVLTLVQTRKMHPIPVILVDRRYWSGLIDWIESTVLTQGCVSEHDLDLVHVVDTAEEAVAICNQSVPVPRDELRRG